MLPMRIRGERPGYHVVVVGSGGVIGSQLVGHVARMGGVRRVTLVDPDVYDESNLGHQEIERSAVGRPKVAVQAERVRAIDERLDVVALQNSVEDVPIGRLRADVLLSCPDSRRARQAVNAVVWRLGMPWIDAGVDAGGGLARVTVRYAREESACLECGWSAEDHTAASTEYACSGRAGAVHATRSPAWLGGIAAAMQAAELWRMLGAIASAQPAPRPPGGWQWVVDTTVGASVVTLFRRNPACRFDHATWAIQPIARAPADVSVDEALSLAGSRSVVPVDADIGASDEVHLAVPGRRFVRRVVCVECGAARSTLVVSGRVQATVGVCAECGGSLEASAFHDADHITRATAAAAAAVQLSLAALGLAVGDVIEVGRARFELGGPA